VRQVDEPAVVEQPVVEQPRVHHTVRQRRDVR
jgi:hypothetical protein